MSFAFVGASTITLAVALTRTDPRCSGFPLVCSIEIGAPAGTYTVTASAYDKAPVGGSIPASAALLSTAHVSVTIAAGTNNNFGVTLDGVPASIDIPLFSGTAGTAFTQQPLAVTVKDPDGYAIVGGYLNPVTIADSDSTGATSIATSGSDSPPANELLSSSDLALLTYSGLAFTGATISATSTGATSGHMSFAPTLNPIGPSALVNGVYVNLYGAASPVSFTVSEVGWTNAPYNKSITATPSGGCSSIATITPSSGTTFTATLASSASTSGSCTLTLSDGAGQHVVVPIGYESFGYTGSAQTFAVPTGVTLATVFAAGGQGGVGNSGSYGSGGGGGDGGIVTAAVPVTAGESLQVNVGGKGGNGGATSTSSIGTGGFNGGGNGDYTSGAGGMNGGGGGGASDVREGGTTISPTDFRIIIAGGGGGSGGAGAGGGNGGGTTGASGGSSGSGCSGAGGGTPTGGGGGGGCHQDPGTSGLLGTGAVGGSNSGGGGGGGGLYGGGSGGGYAGNYFPSGGGGGSSFTEPSATNVTNTQGGQSGNGYVIITY